MLSGVITGIFGCVGNADRVKVTGINVDVGTDVGETIMGVGVSGDMATACFSQAARNAMRTIQIYRCGVGLILMKTACVD